MEGDDTVTIIEWLNSLSVSEINFATTYIAKAHIYPITNNCRAHCGFVYTAKGTETYNLSDKSIAAVPNSIIYLPKGSKYKVTLDGDESVVIYIDFELSSTAYPSPFCIKFDDDKTIMNLFSDIEKHWKKKSCDSISVSKSIFYKICSHMIRKGESYMNSGSYAKISESVNYLHYHYTENDFRIEKLYEIAKISSRYYERLFCQRFGETPKEYILKLKIDYAKELLLSEKTLIKDIAIKLGYSDIYHFGKIFKKKTGYTPSQYRRNAPLAQPPKIAKEPKNAN